MQVPFFRPFTGEREIELATLAIRQNATYLVGELETRLSRYVGAKHAIVTNNGTAAKHLALCAIDIKRGDKIVCSVNSFPSVAQVIRQFDAEPVFTDIDEDDFTMSPVSFEQVVERANSKKLRAAFITHVAGQSADMDALGAIAKEYNVKLIDDASRALGSSYKGKLVGTLGTLISCFQINPQIQKSIASTGIITTNDDKIAERARLIRSHALVADSFDRDGDLGYFYDVVDLGQKYDLNSLCAAFSIAQLEKWNDLTMRRKKIAEIYDRELCGVPGVSTPVRARDHIFNQYIVKIAKNRDNFARGMIEHGVKVGLHYIPVHLLSYYKKKYDYRVTDFPVALRVYGQVLSLPIYAAMNDDEVAYVCEVVKQVAKTRV